MKNILILLSLVSLLLLAAVLDSEAEITWHAISSGGGRSTSGIYTLESSIGQPVLGNPSSDDLCSGYQCIADDVTKLFLPLVVR